jgi:hypothetical protein
MKMQWILDSGGDYHQDAPESILTKDDDELIRAQIFLP